MKARQAVLAALAVVLGGLGALAPAAPAGAHRGVLVQLWVSHVSLQPTPAEGWALRVSMVDADSGTPQPGFEVVATASSDTGQAAGPVTLSDAGRGDYAARVPVQPGRWQLDVHAQAIPGGTLAVPLTRSYAVVLEPGRAVSISGSGARSPSAGGGGSGGIRMAVAAVTVAAVLAALFGIGRHRHPAVLAASD